MCIVVHCMYQYDPMIMMQDLLDNLYSNRIHNTSLPKVLNGEVSLENKIHDCTHIQEGFNVHGSMKA